MGSFTGDGDGDGDGDGERGWGRVASNFEVDLDELRRAHGALGQVVAVNEQVARVLPATGSPASRDAPAGSVPASAPRAVAAYTELLGRCQRFLKADPRWDSES